MFMKYLSLLGEGDDEFVDIPNIAGMVDGVGGKGEGEGGVGVVTIVGHKWGRGGGGVWGLIVGKFSNQQPCSPVIMVRVDIGPQNLFNGTVGAFRLAISLGVVGGRNIEVTAQL